MSFDKQKRKDTLLEEIEKAYMSDDVASVEMRISRAFSRICDYSVELEERIYSLEVAVNNLLLTDIIKELARRKKMPTEPGKQPQTD